MAGKFNAQRQSRWGIIERREDNRPVF